MRDTLHILRDKTRLAAIHRRRVERDAETRPVLGDIAPNIRKQAITGFSQLLETEYESGVIAGWMIAALLRLGAPLDLVGAFGKVVEDELRHIDLMSQVLVDLGVDPQVPKAPLPPKPEIAAASLEETLAGLMGFFCVGEELSGHIFKSALDVAEDASMKFTIGEIFRDEATHGAIGFESARELLRLVDGAAQKRIAQRVSQDLQRFEQRLGGPLKSARDSFTAEEKALARLGLLPREALLQIFYERVERNVLPRLADVGLPLELHITKP